MLNNHRRKFENKIYIYSLASFCLGAAFILNTPEKFLLKKEICIEKHFIKEPKSESELVIKILEDYDPDYSVRLHETYDDGLVYIVAGYATSNELGAIIENYDEQKNMMEYLGESIYNEEMGALQELWFGDAFMGIDLEKQHILEINLFTDDIQAILNYNGNFEADLIGPFVYMPYINDTQIKD
jgi:hypothetical protein